MSKPKKFAGALNSYVRQNQVKHSVRSIFCRRTIKYEDTVVADLIYM